MDNRSPGVFPTVRMRRLRYHSGVRRLVSETKLTPEQMILPLFVRHGDESPIPIQSMPGHYQLSVTDMVKEVKLAKELGIGGVLLFGIPKTKDAIGSDALSDSGLLARAISAVKEVALDDFPIVTDLCFCEYTDHGHCGVLQPLGNQMEVDNDATLENIAIQALVHARAGADIIAPSGMIDGMIGVIRQALDSNGFNHLPIMSYAAKYASSFYGPFREAAESAPQFGNRRSYQMDPSVSPWQAVREVELDIAEGADMVMVKPALPYLDIIRMVRDRFPALPLAAYNVSGEYSMVKAAATAGWIDEKAVALESLTAIARAGATVIITYWAKDVAKWL